MTSPSRGRPKERTSIDNPPAGFMKSVSYVDTVVAQFFCKIPPIQFRRALIKEIRPYGRYVRKRIPTVGEFYIFKLWLHQPTSGALKVLAEGEERGLLKLIEVHVALDFIADSLESADLLRQHVEGRLLPSVRAKRIKRSRFKDKTVKALSSVGNTTYYFKDIGAGTEIAMYSDRFSKTAYGEPCCHLEYRLKGAKELRAANLPNLQEVCFMDHRKFWDAKLAFWRPPTLEAIARAGNGSARSRTPESMGSAKNVRDAHLMIRLATHLHHQFLNCYLLYLELRDSARRYNDRPIRLFQKLDHDWALPSPQNGLWPSSHLRTATTSAERDNRADY